MLKKEREPRVRQLNQFVTNKKPQAKDVCKSRALTTEDMEKIKQLEDSIRDEQQFINPVADKKRKYLAEDDHSFDHLEKDSAILRLLKEMRQEQNDMEESSAYELDTECDTQGSPAVPVLIEYPLDGSALSQDEPMNVLSQENVSMNETHDTESRGSTTPALVLPTMAPFDIQRALISLEKEGNSLEKSSTVSMDSTPDTESRGSTTPALVLPTRKPPNTEEVPIAPEEEENPLEKSFKETARLVEQSPLKTVKSEYLYSVLPRQAEINAYKYVKEDVSRHSQLRRIR